MNNFDKGVDRSKRGYYNTIVLIDIVQLVLERYNMKGKGSKMLETRNLRKVYKTKKSVSVEALKGISLKFPEKGMIFLLGKSGSGKSTLLNLLGGLDKYDDGEIIIKGVSSKNFKQNHFDSYRNTYVGFIFQEYNVLEEFSVGANIALAIELQNRKATDEEISKILRQVDLDGFGDRKPNELSGGQKQRVAIARALVKNPQIIMADEPTGALDSSTGKQVFDTLKKLSEEKLVIVVSHDREFAEQYGDRIIELADGKVISDVEKTENDEIDFSQGISFEEDGFIISEGYHLTEEDRIAINEYMDSAKKDVKATIKAKKYIAGNFKETNQDEIDYVEGEFKLIKSKLPLKNSFKIGASSLKHKKFRLVITILLSFVAFGMFALADTFGTYDHIKTCTNSISDSNIKYASISKSKKMHDDGGTWWDDWSYKLTDEDITNVSKETGHDFRGVYVPDDEGMPLTNIKDTSNLSENEAYCPYATTITGFADVNQKLIDKMGYKILAGKLPDGSKNEIAISEYVYKTYEKTGYLEGKNVEKISNYKDIIGKTIELNGESFTVTAVIDTNVDLNRYKTIGDNMTGKSNAETLAMYALNKELDGIKEYSLSCVAMTGDGYVENLVNGDGKVINVNTNSIYMDVSNSSYDCSADGMTRLSDADKSKITWIGGEKSKLADDEIIVPEGQIYKNGEDVEVDDFIKYLKNEPFFNISYSLGSEEEKTDKNWKIVGVIKGESKAVYVVPDKFYEKDWIGAVGTYNFAVSSMPDNKADIQKLVKYCYTEKDNVKFKMQNSVTFELDSVDEILSVLSKVFLYVGLGFALFATIMLSNFIATSIAYKKQEIGILRAIGARSNDVFRIFFSESFIIAVVNFALATIAAAGITVWINGAIRKEAGVLITVLNFGPRQIILLLLISLGVAALASFVPVYRIAAKRPIEAIRNK